MTQTIHSRVGELIAFFYQEYLGIYGDEDLASVATAATINEILTASAEQAPDEDVEAA